MNQHGRIKRKDSSWVSVARASRRAIGKGPSSVSMLESVGFILFDDDSILTTFNDETFLSGDLWSIKVYQRVARSRVRETCSSTSLFPRF